MFKVDNCLEEYRERGGMFKTTTGDLFGRFFVKHKSNTITIMASDGIGDGWEHVSISLKNRCPNWEEMCLVKSWFWDDEDCVMQLHPPKSEWISNHPYCLHLWRPVNADIPRPPNIAVGIKGLEC